MSLRREYSRDWGILFSVFLFCVLFGQVHSAQAADLGLRWVKATGGAAYDSALSVDTDASGNVYVTGYFNGTVDFDPGIGTDNHASNGQGDIYLSKFSADGAYRWTRTWGSSTDDEYQSSLTVGPLGDTYVTGFFRGTVDFDPGAGNDSRTSAWHDVFITKYDAAGGYHWTRAFGGSVNDWGSDIVVQGIDLYVVGSFSGTVDFNPGAGVDNRTSNEGWDRDSFFAKYDTNGNYQWTRTSNLRGDDGAEEIVLPGNGAKYVAMNHYDYMGGNGGYDAVLYKYDPAGTFEWSRSWGGTGDDNANTLTADLNGNVYIGGVFDGTVDFNPGSGTDEKTSSQGPGSWDAYFSKFDSLGNYQWVRTFQTVGSADSIELDDLGRVYVAGSFYGDIDFDPVPGSGEITSAGGEDGFLGRYDASGNFDFAFAVGGTGSDRIRSLESRGNDIYAVGYFEDTVDFSIGNIGSGVTSNGVYDSFIAKYYNKTMNPATSGPSPTPDTTPTFTFTLPVCGIGNLQYRIEIDDDPDFGSPAVDYTSGPKEAGNNFFTVGQPEGTGSYAIGSEGQELPYGTYSWAVSSICNSNPSDPDDGDPITIEPAVSVSAIGTQLDINATISIACDPSVTMNALIGTGPSTINENNQADCTVITNNSAGYALSWQASTDDLINAQSDHFAAYSPVASTTPETWDIPNTTSAWGAKLASTSEGYNGGAGGNGYTYPGTGWGSDDSYGSGRWLNVAASEPVQFMQKSTETDVDGELQSIMFGAEIGADKIQPTGTYTTNVTVTAVTLSGGGGGGGGGGQLERLFSAAAFSKNIYVLDKDTFATLEIITVTDSESLNINNFNGAAVQPSTGDVYVVANVGSRQLGVVDLDTGVLTRVGNLNGNFAAIAFADDGALYGLTGDGGSPASSLYSINPLDASKTLLASYTANSDGEALAFNPDDGLLYRATGDDLYAIDPGDPNNPVTIFENNGDLSGFVTALYYNGNDELLFADVSSVYSVNLGGPDVFSLGSMDNGSKGLFGGMWDAPVACVTRNTVYNQYVNGDLDVTDCTAGFTPAVSYWEKITFSGTLGDQIIITGDFDTTTGYMYLIDDSDDSVLWELGDAPAPAHVDSVSAITLPTTGTYTVWVRDYTDTFETGTYSVYISDGE